MDQVLENYFIKAKGAGLPHLGSLKYRQHDIHHIQ